MQRITDEVWPGSYLTEGDDLDALKQQREWASLWGGELGKEAEIVFTAPINHYNFFIQFKDMTLASYSFDTWTEMESVLYDNHITVSKKANYGDEYSFYLLKYDDVTVGYAAGKEGKDCHAHINSRFEIKPKASPSEN